MRIVVTPSCPVCGSKKTGYFVAGNDPELKEKYFLKGERIRLRSVPNGKNCFCADCGMEWRDQLFKNAFPKKTLKLTSWNTASKHKESNIRKSANTRKS